MKVNLYTFSLLLLSGAAFSQIPTGYYDSANGLTGAALKTKLSQIITNGHVDKGYSGLWTAYQTTDIDKNYENDGSILDMYSENPSSTDPYKFVPVTDQCGTYSVEGDCYNREHVVPQSLFAQAAPMVSDLHHIRATDGKVNGMRSNYPFGAVGTATWTSRNGGKLGNSVSAGFTGTVFEPINEFKGDVARMIFYFVTRYESKLSTFTTGNMLGTTAYPGLQTWERDVLLAWHAQDPVSAAEINRNNASYTFQGNRNPFIDRPEYVSQIWGGSTPPPAGDTAAPSTPTNISATNITQTSATINWTASTDNVGVTSYKVYKNGALANTVTSNSASWNGLTAGTNYTVTVEAFDAAGNKSALSSGYSFSTTASTAPATELYISEYLEGSSNNKALEISNRTANAVALSAYSIRKQVNGASTWTTVATLSGTLNTNTTYVLAHSSYALTCTGTINLKTSLLDFNGNDAVGLFKNGVLIDLLGYNANATVFAQDKTLRRNVSAPKTTYNTSEWTVYGVDVCTDLGTVNPTGTAKMVAPVTATSSEISIYPNPVTKGELTVQNATETAYEIYSSAGQLVQKGDLKNGKILLKNLGKGAYLLKVSGTAKRFLVH